MVSFPTPKCPGVTQGSLGVVWLLLGPHHGDSYTQRRLRCLKSGHGCPRRHHNCPVGVELMLELYQEYPGVVKLVMKLHHVSQGSKQGEFRGGEASDGASPCESRGQARGVPGWWS